MEYQIMVNGWYDNQAGLVDYTQPSSKPKIVVKKRGKVDINSLSFDELKEIYAEASLRLEEYCKHSEAVQKLIKDQIVGTVKYLTLVKVRMSLIASGEQSVQLSYLSDLEDEKLKNSKLIAELTQKLSESERNLREKTREIKKQAAHISEMQGRLASARTFKARRK
ncbi:hypothetical protein [Acinetobacter sp. CFCC 10889]|uniref:hypothetical protein n=1 Tax=Acinetobacter sp. CFCC 10889 TaxID=1775557 RepID=UPI0013A6F6D6|nr:hypothetical protein [Acinetobacter sp. CFCC 10889]